MISAFFGAASEAATAFVTMLSGIIQAVTAMFYVSGTGADAGLTTLGTLSLIGLGVGAVYFIWRLISSLIRVRGR